MQKLKYPELEKIIMRVAILFILLSLALIACSHFNEWVGVPDDNPIEESIESLIERQSGIDFDLTPASKE